MRPISMLIRFHNVCCYSLTEWQCPLLTSGIEYGRVVRYSNVPAGVAEFACDTGYRLVGSPTSTCRHDRTWSHAAPSCERK